MTHRIQTEAERTGTRHPNFFEHWPVNEALLRSPVDYELLRKHCHAQKNVQKNVTDIVRICGKGSG